MQEGILDNFILPTEARQDFKRIGAKMVAVDDGVSVLTGHDKGLPFRFFTHAEFNKLKSEAKGVKCQLFDNEIMIEWNKSKRMKPTERVRFLPHELLYIDEDGEVSGRYAEAYLRFKKGLTEPGLSLSKWDVIDEAQCATLVAAGIFTVEQLAACPRNKVMSKFPASFIEIFERAILFANSKERDKVIESSAREILLLQQQLAEQKAEMDALRKQADAKRSVKAKPVAKKKEEVSIVDNGEEDAID